jgi:hypothetical protein
VREVEADGLTRYSYRLRDQNDDGPVESVTGFIFSEDGHLQLAVYFDNPSDESKARSIVDSVARSERA